MTRMISLLALVLCVPIAARAQCSATAQPVNFGTYLPFSGSPASSTGSVTVSCLLTLTFTVSLSAGQYGGGNFSNRRMLNAGSYLSYQLYTTSADTTVWGDGTGGTAVHTCPLCVCVLGCLYTVFGQIPARQAARPGGYLDTIVVTVSF